jgi:hypothetical protein
MRKAVRIALKKGAKAIKVIATGGVMTPNDFMDDPQLSVAEMHVAVEEAHHKGHIVAAHAEGNPGIMNAIQAGVDSIEHGFYVTDDEIDLMLKQGTYLTPTLVADWAIPTFAKGKIPDWEVKKAADALDDLYKNIMNGICQFTLGVIHNRFYIRTYFFKFHTIFIMIALEYFFSGNFQNLFRNVSSYCINHFTAPPYTRRMP